jgi:uncharacterized protein YecT (DUF1311 family)
MKTIKLAILAVLLAATVSAKPDNSIDPAEAKLEELVKQSPKAGLPQLLNYNIMKLDSVYKAALKSADDQEHRKALEESQKAWLAFFEADGAVASWNAKGGSYAYPAQVEQKIYQVRMRIYQLATPFMQGWPAVPRLPNPEAEPQR